MPRTAKRSGEGKAAEGALIAFIFVNIWAARRLCELAEVLMRD